MKTLFLYCLIFQCTFASDYLTKSQQDAEMDRAFSESRVNTATPLIFTDDLNIDLTSLQSQHPATQISSYREDMGAKAKQKLAQASRTMKNYSLARDLVQQVIRGITSEISRATTELLLSIPSEHSGMVLYLGRSPSILQKTCSHFSDNEGMLHTQINFSGTPNMRNSRKYEVNELRNVVTTERLEHFCHYLQAKQLGDLTEKSELYIVDQLGTGASMNAFLQILHHFYTKVKSLRSTPKITLLLMNFQDEIDHTQKDMYYFSATNQQLTFYGSSETGLRGMTIKAIPLCMQEHDQCALDILDDEMVQYYLLRGREYPAYCWTEEYDTYRDSHPELATTLERELLKLMALHHPLE